MLVAVVPAQNESTGIATVISTLLKLPIDLIIPVINGCSDNTLQIVLKFPQQKLWPLIYTMPLGIDVPRAIGAYHGYKLGASSLLFVDGDMTGSVEDALGELIETSHNRSLDIALANCYPNGLGLETANQTIICLRRKLNQQLGLDHLGLATPAHGPHLLSRKVIGLIPLQSLAIPPVSLVQSNKHNLNIGIGTQLPHARLGSANRGPIHNQLVSETLIGDLLQALRLAQGLHPSRFYGNKEYKGYHPHRRFDLIKHCLG